MGKSNPRDLAMFGFLKFFTRVCRTHPRPHGMEGFRIGERLRLENRRLLLAMGLAIVTGTLGAFWAMLWAFNRYGIAAQMSTLPEYFGRETWGAVDLWLNYPARRLNAPTNAIAVGTLFALGLAGLRMNLSWWPFHPVGYAISASYTMERRWFCVFIAWLAKVVIMRYGGYKMYMRLLPLFMGLILGEFVIGGAWSIIGVIWGVPVFGFWRG